jgi:hypothetical protein
MGDIPSNSEKITVNLGPDTMTHRVDQKYRVTRCYCIHQSIVYMRHSCNNRKPRKGSKQYRGQAPLGFGTAAIYENFFTDFGLFDLDVFFCG